MFTYKNEIEKKNDEINLKEFKNKVRIITDKLIH